MRTSVATPFLALLVLLASADPYYGDQYTYASKRSHYDRQTRNHDRANQRTHEILIPEQRFYFEDEESE